MSLKCFFFSLLIGFFLLETFADAQVYEKKIFEYVRMVSEGNCSQVATKLPEIMRKIPHSAGVFYLEGLIATRGDEAIKYFSVITDSFPRSDWADDALARLFEYHQNVGNPREAERNYERLKTEYPASPYLTTNYLRNIRFLQDQSPKEQGREYAVQIGAFSIRENAEKLQQRFASEGYNVDIYENLLDGKSLLYLVWIGSYYTEGEAQQVLLEIKSKYKTIGVVRMRSSWKKW